MKDFYSRSHFSAWLRSLPLSGAFSRSHFLPSSCLFLCISCHRPVSLQKERALQSLLDNKEHFKLRSALALYEDSISEGRNRWFHAFTDNAFNRNTASAVNIHALLKEDASVLPDSLKARN